LPACPAIIDALTHMNFNLRCHLCQTAFPATALWVCDKCLGPLEVTYDYATIARGLSRALIESRPKNLWRYRELLPIEGDPRTGLNSGFTPLVRANRLAARLGVKELYVKDDSVNHPTCSYKDRVVSIAATRAIELGFTVFSCASTGNLAGSVASHAARLGLSCYVFIPDDLEAGKVAGASIYRPRIVAVRGNYDDVNRLCTQVADKYKWGIREHQPAGVLRRGCQDVRLRDCGAARVAVPAARRLARRRRDPPAADPQGLRGIAHDWTRRGRPAVDSRGASGRLRPRHPRA
jgi:threonine synthase